MGLERLFSDEEVKSKTKIGKIESVEYNRYDFMNEEEKNKSRTSAIENWAPKGARFFRIMEINPVNYYTEAVKVEYYS